MTHSIRHLPAGVLLSTRLPKQDSVSWIRVLLLIAAALALIAIMGLIKVAATAGDLDLTFGTNGKVTSREYQERFSPVVLHSNAECPQ